MRRASRAQRGKRIAILAFGPILYAALRVAESLDASVVNMRFIKPLDIELVHRMAQTHDALVTVEEGSVLGGAGSACIEALQVRDSHTPILSLGLPDAWVEHGDPVQITATIGLDAVGLLHSIHARFPEIVGDLPGLPQRAANA